MKKAKMTAKERGLIETFMEMQKPEMLSAEIARLRHLLQRHDLAARKDERQGIDAVWTPEFRELVSETRLIIGEAAP